MTTIHPRLIGEVSIIVGGVQVTPHTTRLFALLLALVSAPPEGMSKAELQELLCDDPHTVRAAHQLRQQLYYLRQMGVSTQATADSLVRVTNPMTDVLGAGLDERIADGEGRLSLTVLPHYNPKLTRAFGEWLDDLRQRLTPSLHAIAHARLRQARERCDWRTASRLADALQAIDPFNSALAAERAESRAMLGYRDEAIAIVDAFMETVDEATVDIASLHRLRTRISRARIPRQVGTLYGRKECLGFLDQQWAEAADGGGRATIVVGPPGIGKTRVADAFAAKVRLAGGRVIHHRCDGNAGEQPLALFRHIKPELQRMRGGLGASPLYHEALKWLHQSDVPSGKTATPDPTSSGTRRTAIHSALIDLIEAASSEGPILIVVDDAHLLDASSSGVIRALADSDNSAHALVVMLARPRSARADSVASARRAASHALAPLSTRDARALLAELRSDEPSSETHAQWVLDQADGNPFYIHALAADSASGTTALTRLDSIASSIYLSLAPAPRLVLETCLLLDTLASPGRVEHVVQLTGAALLDAVRQLEELDLLRLESGTLRGPHALLHESLQRLVPGAIRSILHERIALTLAGECQHDGYVHTLAWVAVQHWMASGDHRAALSLARRCAQESLLLGEPGTGARLLASISQSGLSVESRRALLDDLIQLAEAGGCHSIWKAALRDRMTIAEQKNENLTVRAALSLALAAGASMRGQDLIPQSALERIMRDPCVDHDTRADAAFRALANADLAFDAVAAARAYQYLSSLCDGSQSDRYLRAALVYHVAFGSADAAAALLDLLAADCWRIGSEPADQRTSTCVVTGLLRMGQYARVYDVAPRLYEAWSSRGIFDAAEYAALAACESAICLGEFDDARTWLGHANASVKGRASESSCPQPPYYSSAAFLAARDGDFASAETLLRYAERVHPVCRTPRNRATSLAHRLRVSHLQGTRSLNPSHVTELQSLHRIGRTFGGQDAVAEAIWCAMTRDGSADGASRYLLRYLRDHRRESGEPEWSLRHATRGDPAWTSLELPQRSAAGVS
jgi:DNA-binding SARP family transcriptional activator